MTDMTTSEAAPSADWISDCHKWRGRLLIGKFGHWCHDWDGLPVDETTPEWDCCTCYTEDEKNAR